MKLVYNENIITNETDTADFMNDYITSVATTIDSNIPDTILSPLTYINHNNYCSFHLHNTYESTIL